MLQKKIKIPKFLQEVHGNESTIEGLIYNYLAVAFVTSVLILMANNVQLTTFKYVIYILLSIDLSGGVVSNFMEGTSAYYASSSKKRYIFISLHVIQPLLMCWLFPNEIVNIVTVALYTLLTMFIVNYVYC